MPALASRIIAVDVDDLTARLADRLGAIVPAGFCVEAADGMLRYSADEGRPLGQHGDHHVGGSVTDVRRTLGRHSKAEDQIVNAAVRVLDDLRNYIKEAGHDPWPGTRNPRSHAQIRDSVLHLWYGESDEVVLGCKPIPLADVGDAEGQGSGLDASMVQWAESVGTVASPLLAGFSLTSVIVVAEDPQKFYWAGATIVSLTVAAITLIGAVQSSKYVHREDAHAEAWYHATRVLYHNGILALLLGLGFALVPGSSDWARRVAAGLALAAALGETIFFSREATSDARAAFSFIRRFYSKTLGNRLSHLPVPGRRRSSSAPSHLSPAIRTLFSLLGHGTGLSVICTVLSVTIALMWESGRRCSTR